MSSKKMFLSLVPWVAFTFLINRHGVQAAGIAALAAAALSVFFMIRGAAAGVKVIDVAGAVLFGGLSAACFAGGPGVTVWVADYGRGTSALLLGAVMLASVAFVPFSEQFARETVPAQHWQSPVFRTVNRKISALWGVVLLVMGAGHLLAAAIDPATTPAGGIRPIDLLLNWAVPAALILAGVTLSGRIADRAEHEAQGGDPTAAAAERFAPALLSERRTLHTSR